jgi:hypothetical protein
MAAIDDSGPLGRFLYLPFYRPSFHRLLQTVSFPKTRLARSDEFGMNSGYLSTRWVNSLARSRGVPQRLVGRLVPRSCSWAAGLMGYGFCPAFALTPRIKNKGWAYGEASYSRLVYRFLM